MDKYPVSRGLYPAAGINSGNRSNQFHFFPSFYLQVLFYHHHMRLSPKHLHPYSVPPISLSTPTTASPHITLNTNPTNMGQTDLVEELTLRIQCNPIVSYTPPLNTKSLTIKSGGTTAHDTYHAPQWQVFLTRVVSSRDSLEIQLHSPPYSHLPTNFRSVNVIYHRRHLASISLNESAFSNWGELKCE